MKKLSFEEHVQLGVRLKELRQELLDLSLKLSGTYGTSRKAPKVAVKAYRAIDDLRFSMEPFLNKDCPGLRHNVFLNVYSGRSKNLKNENYLEGAEDTNKNNQNSIPRIPLRPEGY